MYKITVIIALIACLGLNAQTFPPGESIVGTTAIHKDSPSFVGWATANTVVRGFIQKSNPTLVYAGSSYATVGVPESALGAPDGAVVSLGDGGTATVTFAAPIFDGVGFDFAVFENGFNNFLELAFVEASSDGIHFFRFPATSQTQTATQVGSFGSLFPTYLNNLAGKYGGQYGTPFDINELPDDVLLDKNSITHIKVIDVVGSIDPLYASFDSLGNAVNDPYPTPFSSGGFDLSAVGVINQLALGIDNPIQHPEISLYPNPSSTGRVFIYPETSADVRIVDAAGRTVVDRKQLGNNGIDVSFLSSGIYFAQITTEGKELTLRLLIQ